MNRVNPRPLIAVRDVEASSRWYQQLLGAEGSHGGSVYEQITVDGSLILQLHAWEEENHPNLTDRDSAPAGHGVPLWFHVPAFDDAVMRARELDAEIVLDVFVNPNADQRELWLRDPDGYVVVIAGNPDDHGKSIFPSSVTAGSPQQG
jgi:catechol 2,3-dioxygenase-like lactoylglutathione lyase family enzyme